MFVPTALSTSGFLQKILQKNARTPQAPSERINNFFLEHAILTTTLSSHLAWTESPQDLQVFPCLLKPHIDVWAARMSLCFIGSHLISHLTVTALGRNRKGRAFETMWHLCSLIAYRWNEARCRSFFQITDHQEQREWFQPPHWGSVLMIWKMLTVAWLQDSSA